MSASVYTHSSTGKPRLRKVAEAKPSPVRVLAESSLLDQLSLLSNPTPVELDPEEAYSSLSSSKQAKGRQAEDDDDDDMAEDEAAGRGHYVEVGCVTGFAAAPKREA